MIEIVGVALACGFIIGLALGLKLGTKISTPKIDALDLTKAGERMENAERFENAAQIKPLKPLDPRIRMKMLDPKEVREYAVTGSPRHIPWSRRRKELEQEARQKRRRENA